MMSAAVTGWTKRAAGLLAELAPVALVVVAEAAWISVIAGLLQEFALHDPVLGIPALVAFVVAGVILARLFGARLGDRWPAVGFGLVLGSGAVGWLASPAARVALADGIGPALAAHPGGWLAGLALLRGFAHARIPLREDTIANLLGLGVPGLALAATLGGLIVDPYRTRFLGDSLGAAVVYVAAAVLALALARLNAIGTDAGFDWRRNPPWLVLTIAMVAVAIVVAIPLASVAGTVISIALSVAVGPLFIVALATGFDDMARRIIGFFIGLTIVIFIVVTIFGPRTLPTPPDQPALGNPTAPSPAEQIFTLSLGGLLLLIAIVATIVLIALWMRRAPGPEGLVGETRTIDPSDEGLSPRRHRSRFGFRPTPTTAVQAYVALVDDLDRHADVRRDPAETPAAHAARLRDLGRSGLSLDLLAADYALARYGGLDLPEREDRRAVARWRVLRRRIAARPGGTAAREDRGPSDRAPTPDAERPFDQARHRPF